MAWIYGERVDDDDLAELVRRLRSRGTLDARVAATALGAGGAHRHASAESAKVAREMILAELAEWDDLETTAHSMLRVRERLAAPARGLSIVESSSAGGAPEERPPARA